MDGNLTNNRPKCLFQLLSWFRKAGEDSLSSLGSKLRSAGDVAGVKEVANDFEKLDFIAWVSDKNDGT
jgi:hypothetical protein